MKLKSILWLVWFISFPAFWLVWGNLIAMLVIAALTMAVHIWLTALETRP